MVRLEEKFKLKTRFSSHSQVTDWHLIIQYHLHYCVHESAKEPHQELVFVKGGEESNHLHIDFAEWKLKWKTRLTFYYSEDEQENSISM